MALTFKEKCGNPEEPGSSGHAIEQQKATAFYLLNGGTGTAGAIQASDILAAITQILGKTTYAAGNGNIARTLPLYHPLFTWLYATNISRMWGVGQQTPTAAQAPINSIGAGGSSISQFALYNQYWFQVDFLPRDYPLVQDLQIFKTPFFYYDDTDTLQGEYYFPEWYRFCDSVTKQASANDINLTQFGGTNGTMMYVTQSGLAPGGNNSTTAPTNVSFPGAFQIQLPNQLVKVLWYNVPLRYILSNNSYIAKLQWRNRVNQNPVQFTKFTANPGELLYLGFSYKTYTPPVPDQARLFNAIQAPGQMVNIELEFLYTSRKCTDPPTTNIVNGVDTYQLVANPSRIVNGHNILYNFSKKNYYYATNRTTGLPSFRSFPAEILFTDPDIEGAIPL